MTENELFEIIKGSVKPYTKAEVCMSRTCKLEDDGNSILLVVPTSDRLRVRDARYCKAVSTKVGAKLTFCNKAKSITAKLAISEINALSDGLLAIKFAVLKFQNSQE